MSVSTSNYKSLLPRDVKRYGTSEVYRLHRVDEMEFTAKHFEQIVAICNELLVYQYIFAPQLAFKDRAYQLSDAEGFIKWGNKIWAESSAFLFLLCDLAGNIVAAIDIKSAEPVEAEIGYWASAKSPGLMTNTVQALGAVAPEAGFGSLKILVDPANEKSIGVAERAGAEKIGLVQEKDKTFLKYIMALKASS